MEELWGSLIVIYGFPALALLTTGAISYTSFTSYGLRRERRNGAIMFVTALIWPLWIPYGLWLLIKNVPKLFVGIYNMFRLAIGKED